MNTHPRRLALLALSITALAGGSASAADAATRLVSTTGTDTGMCIATPCKTVTYAAGAANPGDTISIGPGTFAESVAISKSLTLVGAGAGTKDAYDAKSQTFIDASATGFAAIAASGPNVTLRHLRLEGGSTASNILPAVGAGITSAAANVVVDGSVLLQPMPKVEPKNWSAALSVSPNAAAVTVRDTTVAGFRSGIFVTKGAGSLDMQRTTIADAVLADPDKPALLGGPIDAVIAEVPATITDTSVSSTDGIATIDTSLSITRTAIRAIESGVSLGDNLGHSQLTMRDSTVAPLSRELHVGVAFGAGPSGGGAGVTLSLVGDSIFALSDTSAAAIDTSNGTAGTNIVVRNSILRAISPAAPGASDIVGGTEKLNWNVGYTAFTTAKGTGVPAPGSPTNVNAAPQFASEALGDLHLQAGSALLDRGDPATAQAGETDRDGLARTADHDCDGVAQPDLGAYETPGPVCPPPLPLQGPAAGPAKPVLSATGLSTTHFAAKPAAGVHVRRSRTPRGTTLRFTLNEAATVTATIQVAVHRRHRATTYRTLGKITYRGQKTGAGHQALSGRLNGRALATGAYRLTLSATDAAGHVSSPRHIAFAIVAAH